jgi:tetratricopeptide (TPR) repeat protein
MSDTPQDRWTQVEAIVDQALDRPADARDAFVRAACGEDDELRRAAEAWLAACDDPALFPDAPAAVFAAPLVSAGVTTTSNNDPPETLHIGPYRLGRELGRGGMGTVYLAERDDGQLDRRVAIKLMRRGTGDDAHLGRRFLEERQILARLEHPHIATLIDGGITPDGRLYFVMQYIEGLPIDRYCDEQKLTVEARLRIFLNVCAAVQHAHKHQVVHRDLKPGNILVTADGQPKLLDFGIAKFLEPESPGSAELTRTGERLLTPEYASPEQIRGEMVTPASDVHALGVLLHQLLTGQRPFRRSLRTRHDLERAILEDEPTQPSDAVTSPVDRRRLRGDLDAIVLTALRKTPTDRYADAGQLGADIERHLARQPVRARGRAPAIRMRLFARRNRVTLVAAAAGTFLGALVLAVSPLRARWVTVPSDVAGAVLAIGRIVDYRDGAGRESAASLVDMLATNLARTEGLAVISAGRMYELAHQSPDDSSDESLARAARLAGATEILNGAIYPTTTGGMRLDLRRESVSSGTILGAYTTSGADLFALADSATASLVAGLGLVAPTGSIADVTTRSLEAYRLYMDGLQLFYAGQRPAADSAFQAALRVDSMFAMAAYFSARSSPYQWRFASATSAAREEFSGRFARALRLSHNASDRERLTIRAYYEQYHLSPAMRPVAETLAVRYPREIDGHLMLGISTVLQGDLQPAQAHYMRVLALDSSSLRSGGDGCAACAAMEGLIEATVMLDSLSDAERYARRWLSIQPASMSARGRLVEVLDGQGRFAEASALLSSGATARDREDSIVSVAKHLIRAGELATVDTLLRTWSARSDRPARSALLYFQAVALRHQGRFREALVVARRVRSMAGERGLRSAAPPSALVEAQTLFDLGRLREASALFDSIARWPAKGQPASVQAMFRVQALTMMAVSLHAAGDTGRLAVLADSLERDGQRAFMFRPRHQHHFVRGLLHVARGNDDEAIVAFERALQSARSDFGRANMELASIYLRQNRPREAIAVLRPASRGWFLETSNLHISLTEVHERLAQAYDMAGAPDSSAAHWKRVSESWKFAEPQLAARRSLAAARVTPREF